jgi:hypothetical protein
MRRIVAWGFVTGGNSGENYRLPGTEGKLTRVLRTTDFGINAVDEAAKQIADDVCCKHSAFGVSGQEFHGAEPVVFVLPMRSMSRLSVHTFSLDESRFSRNRGRNSRYQRLSQCSDPTLILATPHYGLRYGSAPATGNFQRLTGRPPLVSPLKSCMRRSFTAVTWVQIPSGTPENQELNGVRTILRTTLSHSSVTDCSRAHD